MFGEDIIMQLYEKIDQCNSGRLAIDYYLKLHGALGYDESNVGIDGEELKSSQVIDDEFLRTSPCFKK